MIKASNRPSSDGISSKMHEVFMNELTKVKDFNILTIGQDFFYAMGKSTRAEQ